MILHLSNAYFISREFIIYYRSLLTILQEESWIIEAYNEKDSTVIS